MTVVQKALAEIMLQFNLFFKFHAKCIINSVPGVVIMVAIVKSVAFRWPDKRGF